MDGASEAVTLGDNPKKSPFDELSREDLIKKCKGLLVIAQKAKQAKLDLQNEVDCFKKQLETCERDKILANENTRTLQELVDSLTEQKLNYITVIDAAQSKVRLLESTAKTYEADLNQMKALIIVKDTAIQNINDQLSNFDSENVSLKRQNNRLLDENEQLITQLSELEAKTIEFNEIGLQQRKQLQILEANVNQDKASDFSSDHAVQLEKLKDHISNIQKELASKELINLEIQTNLQQCEEKLSQVTLQYESEKDKKEKANLKLRSYRDKILKCSACINQLKNSRFILAKTVKDYSENIPKWQNDIIKASKILDNQIMVLNNENKILKEQFNYLQQKHDEITSENKELKLEIHRIKSSLKNDTNQSMDDMVKTMQLQIKSLESEKSILVKEKSNARDQVVELERRNQSFENENATLRSQNESSKTELDTLCREKLSLEQGYKKNGLEEINQLKAEVKNLKKQCDDIKKENENLNDLNAMLKEEVATMQMSLEHPTNDPENLTDLNVSLQADIVKLETKLSAYKQENSSLLLAIKESRTKVKKFDALLEECEEAKSKLAGYKTENSELLNEMKEVNQVLKERGETISKQQKAIVEMERLIETLEKDRFDVIDNKNDLQKRLSLLEDDMTKLQQSASNHNQTAERIILERDNAMKDLAEKDVIISSLKDEIEKLKQQPTTAMEITNDDMSTSTISKAEEHSRMKDLDETFEEKYSKLRIFALKLKKRLNETTVQLRNAEQDKAKLENMLKDNCEIIKQDVDTNNEEARSESAATVQDDKTSDTKKFKENVKELTTSLETISLELQNAKADLTAKELALANEIEEHKSTKEHLEKAKRDVKKKSVLSLEMEDYERSMKDLTTKMDDNKKKMVQMESTIDTQQGTINTMKTQIKLLEDQIKSEETQNRLTKEELQQTVEEGKEKDDVIQAKNEIISKLEKDLEDEKLKNEEVKLEMTSLLGEKEKALIGLCEEKLELNNRLKRIEFKCADLEEMYKITNIELDDLKTEYASYKVRAQAVLRQNQTVDHSQEEQLKEELAALKAQIESLTANLISTQQQCEELRSSCESERRRAGEAAVEAGRAAQRTARLQADLARLTSQLDADRAHHKLQTSTLTQCYKTQISELEAKLQRETDELKNQLVASQERYSGGDPAQDKLNRNSESYMLPIIPGKDDGSDSEIDINVSMLPREEGEGSESAPSPPPSKSYMSGGNRSPVPLERLLEEGVPDDEAMDVASLALTPEQEISEMRRKLQTQLQRVKHVTVLLAESERDCARHAQLNELLKAEVRRARGSLERTQHAHNAEYMKNVTLKFVTLPPGDERSRLVPVLQKILTLNPEETQRLNSVAKGSDPNQSRGWGSYLPWPGTK